MRLTIYRTYRFIDKDPIIDAVRTVVKSKEKLRNSDVHAISGVATATLDNWFDGGTRRPHNSTVCAVTSSLGYVRQDSLDRNGQLVVGFAKYRSIDRDKEIEKQADWFLKHSKRKRKNSNGK